MIAKVAIQAASVGFALEFASAKAGAVHSVFAHAVNLEVGEDLWTLLAADQSDLPFGIRTLLKDFSSLDLRAGKRVAVRAGFVDPYTFEWSSAVIVSGAGVMSAVAVADVEDST